MEDLIRRQDVITLLEKIRDEVDLFDKAVAIMAIGEIKNLPSVDQEEFEWCHDCKEYDQEKHCCHRWTKVIRQTLDDLKENPKRTAKILNRFEGFYSAHGVCICGHCENCGNEVCDDFRFCPHCGSELEWNEGIKK